MNTTKKPLDIPKFKESVGNLMELSKRLNEASDILGVEITKIEEAINSLKLGVEALVLIPNKKLKTALIYGRFESKWGMIIAEETEDNKDYQEWPFYRAPRHLRISAIDFIPNLLEQLLINVQELIPKIEEAGKLAQSFIDRINKDKQSKSVT